MGGNGGGGRGPGRILGSGINRGSGESGGISTVDAYIIWAKKPSPPPTHHTMSMEIADFQAFWILAVQPPL